MVSNCSSPMPLVSIGIPTYNRPSLLRQAIECALAQTYINLEITVSDNCSSDSTVNDVLNEYRGRDSRLTIVVQPKNIGIYRNAEFLLEHASGKYFTWLSDDDQLANNYIEKCVEFLENNNDYSMASAIPYGLYINGEKKLLPVLNLEMNNRYRRMSKYFFGVEDNTVYYSLVRREQVTHFLLLPQYPGNDWLMVERMLYRGKSKILQDSYIIRSMVGLSGNSDSFRQFFNCSRMRAEYPRLFLLPHTIKDIMCGEMCQSTKSKFVVLISFLTFFTFYTIHPFALKRYIIFTLSLVLPVKYLLKLQRLKINICSRLKI